jgi:antitoxin (DNA-binding transcriptional repressor) of toxin-antitoxin stability system
MMQVSVEGIPRDLSASLQRVKAGATLVIVRAGQPVAALGAAPGCLQPPLLHRSGCRQ